MIGFNEMDSLAVVLDIDEVKDDAVCLYLVEIDPIEGQS